MKITEIQYGFTKNIGNYQNQRLSYRAILEPWENPEESLEILRDRVAQELDLPEQYHNLKHKFARQLTALEKLEEKLETKKAELAKAERAWENFSEFLTIHGVDPSTLNLESYERNAKIDRLTDGTVELESGEEDFTDDCYGSSYLNQDSDDDDDDDECWRSVQSRYSGYEDEID